MNQLLNSKLLTGLLIILGALLLLAVGFRAGLAVGEQKAQHAMGWTQRYGAMFDPKGDRPTTFQTNVMPMIRPPLLPETHGAFGKIISASGQEVVIIDRDGIEQHVLVTPSTTIRMGHGGGTAGNLHVDTDAAVFGTPNQQGQIEARLIRIFETR